MESGKPLIKKKSKKLSWLTKCRKNIHFEHLLFCVLFLAQGIVQFVLSDPKINIPIRHTFPQGPPWDVTTQYGFKEYLIQPMYFVASFMVITGCFHLLYAFLTYTNIGFTRWIEYSITSTIMVVAISLMSGIQDLFSLIVIGVCNIVMILTGMIIDDLAMSKNKYQLFALGSVAGVGPWIVIFTALGMAAQVPPIVYAITIVLFLFFNSFAVHAFMLIKYMDNQKYQDKKESIYMFLSLFSKTSLSWLVYSAFLIAT